MRPSARFPKTSSYCYLVGQLENEAFSLAGAFAPPALKGVDNPTFAHRPLARPVDKQGYPPHALPPSFKSFFLFFLSNTAGGSRCRRTAGGLQAPRGTGGAAPCRGSPKGRRGTRWGLYSPPFGGLLTPLRIPKTSQNSDTHYASILLARKPAYSPHG